MLYKILIGLLLCRCKILIGRANVIRFNIYYLLILSYFFKKILKI